ncbi:hypothetical protein Tco_1181188, partial [Tanacetum coccineum]
MTMMLVLKGRVVQKRLRKFKKGMQDALDDMMRSRCNSQEEHAYYLDQMKRYMENQIVWESRTEELTEQVPVDPSLAYQGCERNPNAPPRYLYNKDLFYLKYGNSEKRKYVLSLHKIHVISFLENDLEELKSRWVRKVIKRFKLEACYVVQHWKGTWAKISYIKGQLATRPNPDDVYSDQKIVEVIRIQYDQGHCHTSTMAETRGVTLMMEKELDGRIRSLLTLRPVKELMNLNFDADFLDNIKLLCTAFFNIPVMELR